MKAGFFSHVLLQIATTWSLLRANSHERASRSYSKIRRPTVLFDRTARVILREFTGLFVSMWSGNHDEWLTRSRARLYYFAKRIAPRYISLRFFYTWILHLCLFVPSTINSRSFGPRFDDRISIGNEEGRFIKLSKQRPFLACKF